MARSTAIKENAFKHWEAFRNTISELYLWDHFTLILVSRLVQTQSPSLGECVCLNRNITWAVIPLLPLGSHGDGQYFCPIPVYGSCQEEEVLWQQALGEGATKSAANIWIYLGYTRWCAIQADTGPVLVLVQYSVHNSVLGHLKETSELSEGEAVWPGGRRALKGERVGSARRASPPLPACPSLDVTKRYESPQHFVFILSVQICLRLVMARNSCCFSSRPGSPPCPAPQHQSCWTPLTAEGFSTKTELATPAHPKPRMLLVSLTETVWLEVLLLRI